MKESRIQTNIIKYLDSLDKCWTVKTIVVNKPGTPDILCCYKGRFYAFEVKAANGKPTKLQLYRAAEIESAGGKSYIVKSLDEVKVILS